MIVVPAIDLKDGRCVRLVEGRLATERTVGEDPVSQAKAFESLGAQRLHVVDLDGAFEGAPRNAEVIERIARAVRVPIQVGGGLRTEASIERLFEIGVRYAILGTMAVDDPERFARLCARYPDRIVAGVDGRNGRVATEGWVNESSRTILEIAKLAESAGAAAVVSTDITRDGTGRGVNVEATGALARSLEIPVYASGGVSDLADIEALAATRVAGVIVGRALYDGTLDLGRAIRAARK